MSDEGGQLTECTHLTANRTGYTTAPEVFSYWVRVILKIEK